MKILGRSSSIAAREAVAMKRVMIVVLPAALLALVGCGGDTCTSSPAALAVNSNESCTLSPGSTATVSVQLCSKCSDSTPSCQAEFLPAGNPDHLEIAPVVQQCQANAGCAVNGCNVSLPTATCSVAVPAGLSGSMPIQVVGETTVQATLNFGPSTSCAL